MQIMSCDTNRQKKMAFCNKSIQPANGENHQICTVKSILRCLRNHGTYVRTFSSINVHLHLYHHKEKHKLFWLHKKIIIINIKTENISVPFYSELNLNK